MIFPSLTVGLGGFLVGFCLFFFSRKIWPNLTAVSCCSYFTMATKIFIRIILTMGYSQAAKLSEGCFVEDALVSFMVRFHLFFIRWRRKQLKQQQMMMMKHQRRNTESVKKLDALQHVPFALPVQQKGLLLFICIFHGLSKSAAEV